MFQYPTNDLDNPSKLLSLLGSLWYETYDGRQWLLDRIQTTTENAQQTHRNLTEVAASVARTTIPVFHTENWYAVRLRESELNNNDAALWYFDDADLPPFNGSPPYFFDVPRTTDNYVFELPEEIADCWLISNRLQDPSVVLHQGTDYQLQADRNALVLRENPFENELIPQLPIYTDGEITDNEILLWFFRSDIDKQLPWYHLGYVLGIQLDSSQAYLDLLNAAMDAIVGGTGVGHVEAVASMMAGVPLVQVTGEVVEDIYTDANHTLVITDKQVYKHSTAVTVTVTVGEELEAGQSMSDAYELHDFRRGELADSLTGLAMGPGMLSPEFFGEVCFKTQISDVRVTGVAGSERVEWDLGGHPLDVEHFWDIVHTRRLTYDQSLYELLTQDGPIATTINPLQFLAENVLRNNTLVILLRAESFGDNALGLAPARLLRRITPPHVAILFILELPSMSDSVNIDNIDDTSISTFDGMPVLSDTFDDDNADESSFAAKNVSFTCQ